MQFPKLLYSKNKVDKAGFQLLKDDNNSESNEILTNWRACHGYPVNTFQATLRKRIKPIDNKAIVAQRIKRTPSIIKKLKRFNSMRLSQMQDIGGLRVIVSNLENVKKLKEIYTKRKFPHLLVYEDDYISNPKDDGYRSLHLVFKYRNQIEPSYDGLFVELQIRTRLQHAWATSVETMGTFLGQALKSREGEKKWLSFFAITGAAFSILENTKIVPGYESYSQEEIFELISKYENELNVLENLRGFAIAADAITKSHKIGSYNLIVLDSLEKKVTITSFAKQNLEMAAEEYAKMELRAKQGEQIEVVLVSAGPIKTLKKAYPNYFLDTSSFIAIVKNIIKKVKS